MKKLMVAFAAAAFTFAGFADEWFTADFAGEESVGGSWTSEQKFEDGVLVLTNAVDPVVFAAAEKKSAENDAALTFNTTVGFESYEALPAIADGAKAGVCALDGGNFFVVGYDADGATNKWIETEISATDASIAVNVVVSNGVAAYTIGDGNIECAIDGAEFGEVLYTGTGTVSALSAEFTAVTQNSVKVELPAGLQGGEYVVSNVTDDVEIAPIETIPGGNTYELPIGAKIEIWMVPSEGFIVEDENPYVIDKVTAETTVDDNDLPKPVSANPQIWEVTFSTNGVENVVATTNIVDGVVLTAEEIPELFTSLDGEWDVNPIDAKINCNTNFNFEVDDTPVYELTWKDPTNATVFAVDEFGDVVESGDEYSEDCEIYFVVTPNKGYTYADVVIGDWSLLDDGSISNTVVMGAEEFELAIPEPVVSGEPVLWEVTFSTNGVENVVATTGIVDGAELSVDKIPELFASLDGEWDVNPTNAIITCDTNFNFAVSSEEGPGWKDAEAAEDGAKASDVWVSVPQGLADADAKKLAAWAETKKIDFADAGTILPEAFILNCDNGEDAIAEAKEAFKFAEIVPGEIPVINGEYNGTVTILGSSDLESWAEAQTTDNFFKAVLSF